MCFRVLCICSMVFPIPETYPYSMCTPIFNSSFSIVEELDVDPPFMYLLLGGV